MDSNHERKAEIKGILLRTAVDTVRGHIDDGTLDRAWLTAYLEPSDFAYLDSPIEATLWYPVGACTRYIEALRSVEGASDSVLIERGARSAQRVLEGGVYADLLKTAKRWGTNQIASALINLAAQFYNFMEWEVVGDITDDSYEIVVHDAAEFPKVLRLASEGFIRVLYSHATDRELEVTSHQPERNRVVFRVSALQRALASNASV